MGVTQLAPSRTSGRYEVGEVLASGAMGTIHRARDRLARRDVAYKRLRIAIEANRPTLTALFRREYDTLARLDHPSIVSAYDYGVDAEGPYYTMELLGGDDLAKRAPMPHREACRVLRDLASALALVHARRLIHRDVSPNNVRFTRDGQTKLIDFGGLTSFGTPNEVVGTPAFIAPECLTLASLDQRVDLYALGALGYFLLTRGLAVRAQSLDELPRAWTAPVPPPSALVAGIPTELDELVLSLLQHDPDARPASAAHVIERLTTIGGLAPEQDEPKVAMSYLAHPPLRAREQASSEFARQLDALMRGKGGVLILEGGPGAGRTALLEQLTIEAQLRGAAVLRAEGKIHTGPFDAVTHLVREGLAIYPEMGQSFREARSSFLVTVDERLASPIEAAERQARMAAHVKDVLLQIGLRAPIVLLVDDANLVDKPSLALLASLVESVARHPILLALGSSTEPARTDAEVILQGAAKRLTLPALSEEDTVALVDTMFGGVPNSRRLARFLHAESRGNPGHCIELVALLLRRGDIRYTRGTFTLPYDVQPGLRRESVETLVRERLAGLDLESERVVALLALHGGPLTVEDLATASALTEPVVFDALGRVAERHLVVTSGETYALGNQALCEGVAATLSSEQRRQHHLALASLLRARTSATVQDRLRAGMYLIRAGGTDEQAGAALISATASANMPEVGLDPTALPYLEAAVEVFGRKGHPDTRHAHLLILLSVAGFYGDLRAQHRYFERTMRALATLIGFTWAARLRPLLGAKLALVLGFLIAAVVNLVTGRARRWPLRKRLEAYMSTVSSATAAAACVMDTPGAERILAWLDPLANAPENSSIQIARQFSIATVEVSAGDLASAVARYEAVLAKLEQPIPGLRETSRVQLRYGSLHGIAQATCESDGHRALAAADKLAEESVFFAPHAESVRMAYHAFRGEREQAEAHRARAEALALLGGISWSAVVLLNVRGYITSQMTDDVLGLVRACAEFERLSDLSPTLALHHRLAQADLLRLRGQLAQACAAYAEALSSDCAERLPIYHIVCSYYARALTDSGDPARAKELCERLLATAAPTRLSNLHKIPLIQQLALAEAALGRFTPAFALLDAELAKQQRRDNPLVLGTLHRDRAHVALLAGDIEAFEHSFVTMQDAFRTTKNPWLIQQCDALLTRAVRAGVRPAVAAEHVDAIVASSEDMDGKTAIETRGEVENLATQNYRRQA